MTETVDRCLTPILEGLEAGGWADNTLIVFTSDQGEGVAAHRWYTKLSLYGETLRVPFIAVHATHNAVAGFRFVRSRKFVNNAGWARDEGLAS